MKITSTSSKFILENRDKSKIYRIFVTLDNGLKVGCDIGVSKEVFVTEIPEQFIIQHFLNNSIHYIIEAEQIFELSSYYYDPFGLVFPLP